MSEKRRTAADRDGALFNENLNKIPFEELLPHAGRRVAWSMDGTRVLASGHDDAELLQALAALGIQPDEVVWGYVPGEDEDSLLY
jgi:hypothetical protein